MARRVAVMDIGSNSSRLDLFEVGEDSAFNHLEFGRVPTKLVSFVDGDNSLNRKGISLACASLEQLKGQAKTSGNVDEWHVFATASLRGRVNKAEAVSQIKERTGFDVVVIEGKQEAAFGFASLQRRYRPECAVMADVGGGSTEVVVADRGEIVSLESLPLGSRVLSNRFVAGVWPTSAEAVHLRAAIETKLGRYESLQLPKPPVLFGIGGTARALQAIIGEGRPAFDATARQKVEQACPDRLDTMAAGMLVFEGLWNIFRAQRFVASDANPREGYLIKRILGL